MGQRPWEGGCVRRIRDALATLVETAWTKLIVVDEIEVDEDGFREPSPRSDRAVRFQKDVFSLYLAIIKHKCGYHTPVGEVSIPPIEMPADGDLPLAIRDALDQTVASLLEFMEAWCWVGINADCGNQVLVGRIERREFDRFNECLARLDAAIAGTVPGDDDRLHHGIRTIIRIDGRTATVDLAKTTRWSGEDNIDEGFDVLFRTNLHRTPKGHWIRQINYDVSMYEGVIPDVWREISPSEAVAWFSREWDHRGAPIPPDLLALVAADDIDAQPDVVDGAMADARPARHPTSRKADARPAGPSTPRKGNARSQAFRVYECYNRRINRGEDNSDRAIAAELGIDRTTVYRHLKKVRSEQAPPRGSKSSDGTIEAAWEG